MALRGNAVHTLVEESLRVEHRQHDAHQRRPRARGADCVGCRPIRSTPAAAAPTAGACCRRMMVLRLLQRGWRGSAATLRAAWESVRIAVDQAAFVDIIARILRTPSATVAVCRRMHVATKAPM